ncbi:MAG: hypothetical protein ABI609_16915 [Acidobacteriota bacterium]
MLIIAGLVALGWVATRRLAGELGLVGLWWGCGIGLLASVASTLPLVLMQPDRRAQAALLATAVRFFAASMFGSAVVLSGLAPTRPFLVWLALTYAGLLPLDAHFAATWGRKATKGAPHGS